MCYQSVIRFQDDFSCHEGPLRAMLVLLGFRVKLFKLPLIKLNSSGEILDSKEFSKEASKGSDPD